MRSGVELRASLVRGLFAGLAAGVLLGLFHLLLSEPLIAQALKFEGPPAGHELFSRGEQQAGLVIATALYGAAVGGVFGIVWPLLAGRLSAGTPWSASLRLAFIGFATLWLVPFLKYPANPPAVGSPDTIGLRTAGYTGMIAISIAATGLAWWTLRRLVGRELHTRQLIAGAVYLLVVGLAYGLLPVSPDPITIPADLLWSFRLMSVAGQALFWLLLGVVFGLLTMRTQRRKAARAASVAEGRV